MIARAPAAERLASLLPLRGLAGLLMVCSVIGCGSKGPGESKGPPPPVPVMVETVMRRDVPIEVRTIGTAEAVSTVQVLPQVSGLVQEVHFHEGDFVKKGALLFSIDTRPYQATLSAAQAELDRSRALSDQAHQEVERYEKLAQEGLTTQLDLSQRRANAAALDATLTANRAVIRTNAINVQFTAIRSPIDGKTGSLLVHAGNVVRATDARSLVVIRTLTPIYVRFAVPEQYLPSIRGHMKQGPVGVEAKPRGIDASATTGQLTFIENTVDPATGKIDMKGQFSNEDEALWPGQFVDVVIRLGVEAGAIVVPESAVQVGQEGAYTFVVGKDMKAALRHVEVERSLGGLTVVSKGLAPDERVVTEGQVRLRQGTAVTIKTPQAAPPPSSAASPAASGSGAPPPAGEARR